MRGIIFAQGLTRFKCAEARSCQASRTSASACWWSTGRPSGEVPEPREYRRTEWPDPPGTIDTRRRGAYGETACAAAERSSILNGRS